MSATATEAVGVNLNPYRKVVLVKGRAEQIACVDIDGQTYAVTNGPVSVIGLEDDWYEDLHDPQATLATLTASTSIRPDLFTFWQRLPHLERKFDFHTEWEDIAVLPIRSYEHWFNHQIKSRTRGLIRKAEKEGVEVRETAYDDAFVRGMTNIFNEVEVRQGRKFWHYGKDVETVRRQFARYIHREDMIGAYYRDELIGFVMLGNAGCFGITGQIISAIKHRDKATNNLLVAKAVELCERRNLPYLCYLFWTSDSLAEFKRRCGFERMRVPRYYVPLTAKGRLALRLGLHRGWTEMMPGRLKTSLKTLRRNWYRLGGAE